MRKSTGTCVALNLALLACAAIPAADLASLYEVARNRPRTIVYNTDGCDMLYYPKNLPVTVEAFTGRRLKYAVGTKISTISYCPISSGFGDFTVMHVGNALTGTIDVPSHKNDINGTLPFAKIGHDCLEMALEFSRTNGFERFMSIRMNDSHDGGARPDKGHIAPLFSKFRQEHPDCLMGDPGKNRWPVVGKWQWTCCNYAKPEVRDFVRKFVREFCEQYDIEGMELDFCRHLKYFESVSQGGVATEEELRLMSDLMRDIRRITYEFAGKKGRPILLTCRVPDSFDFARAIGLDIRTWLKEKSFDGIIGGCYFNLEDLATMAAEVHAAGAKFYASIDESRICNYRDKAQMIPGRDTVPNFHARYAAAMDAGCDGVYLFNQEYDALRRETLVDLRELDGLDKIYFATERGKGGYEPDHYLKDGYKFKKLPNIDPAHTIKEKQCWIAPGAAYDFTMRFGEDLAKAVATGLKPEIRVMALAVGSAPDGIAVSINGKRLANPSFEKGLFTFAVDAKDVKKGLNAFSISNLSGKEMRINDFAVRFSYAAGTVVLNADSLAAPGDNVINAIIKVIEKVKEVRQRRADIKVEIVPFSSRPAANRELLFFRDRTFSLKGMEKEPSPDLEAGSHLWRTERSHGVDRWRWWYERMRERQQLIRESGGEFDLVMMGDSITHWIDRENGEAIRPELARQGLKWLNCGYGGDHAESLAWRAKHGELDGFKTKLVGVMIGTNNQGKNDTVESTVKAIAEAVATIREKQPQAKVLLMAIFPRSSVQQGKLRARSLEVSRRIRALCDGANVIWTDLRPFFTKEDGTGRFDLLTDGTHPSPAGIRHWIHALSPYIEKYAGKKIDFPNPDASGLKPCTRRWINFRVDFTDEQSVRDLWYFAVKAEEQGYNGVLVDGFGDMARWNEKTDAQLATTKQVFNDAAISLVPVVEPMPAAEFEAAVRKIDGLLQPADWFMKTNGMELAAMRQLVVADQEVFAKVAPKAGLTLFAAPFTGSAAGISGAWTMAALRGNGYFKQKWPVMILAEIDNLHFDYNLHSLFRPMLDDTLCTGEKSGFIYWTVVGDYRYMLDAARLAIRRD